jgi:hypothetical protein
MGILNYRVSDYIFPIMFPDNDPDSYFVTVYGLKRPACESSLDDLEEYQFKVVLSVYYMMTTLSTVGYGDFSPTNNQEKVLMVVIQLLGVTLFATVINKIREIVNTIKGDEIEIQRDKKLDEWFNVIKSIKRRPLSEGRDITP